MVTDRELFLQSEVYGKDAETLAAAYTLSEDSVRGRLSRAGIVSDNIAEALRLKALYAPKTSADALKQRSIIERAKIALIASQCDLEASGETVKVGWVGDVHFPFQYAPSMSLMYQIMEAAQPKYITALNDLFDFDQYGRWATTPTPASALWLSNIDNPISMAALHHRTLRKLVKNVKLLGLVGNHDKRLYAYLRANQNGFTEQNVTEFMLRLEDQGVWQFGYDENVLQLSPGLKLVHGLSTAKNAGEFTVRRMGGNQFTGDAGIYYNTASGHSHRSFEQTINGVTHWNFGCLCTMNPGYTKFPDWQPGCGILEYNPNSRDVFGQRIDFYRRGDYLCARYEGLEYKAKV